MANAHSFYVSDGLLTPGHCQRIGVAVWEFLWLISHETREEGKVLNGAPITIKRISTDLGQAERTTRRNLDRLEAEKYIARERGQGGVYQYVICNSKKWAKSVDKNGQSDDYQSGQKCPHDRPKVATAVAKNGHCNKEDRQVDRVDRNTENAFALTPSPSDDAAQSKASEVIETWNRMAKGVNLPCARLTEKRCKTIQARLNEHGWLEDFTIACDYIRSTNFYRGENDRNWVANIDFLLQADKATALAEKAKAATLNGANGHRTVTPYNPTERTLAHLEGRA